MTGRIIEARPARIQLRAIRNGARVGVPTQIAGGRVRLHEMVHIPSALAKRAQLLTADQWLGELPELVATLEAAWSMTLGEALNDATEAFVAEATLADGTQAVLKLHLPSNGDVANHEITALRLAPRQSCATLLEADPTRGALLLERLGPSLFQLGLPIDQRHEILVSAAQRMWGPVPECDLPSGASKGRWFIEFITATWEELGRPCSTRAIDYAIECAERRIWAHDDERALLVHGDVHQWNAVQAQDGYKLIDPDGLIAEPEYDLGIIMREDPRELMTGDPWDRADWLAARSGLAKQAIWDWGVVQRVATGLLLTEEGMESEAQLMLAVADRVATCN